LAARNEAGCSLVVAPDCASLFPRYNRLMSSELKILCGGAMRPLMTDLVPLFEEASGLKVAIEFRLTSVLQKEIEDGAAFDVALLPRPELDELARTGKIAAGTIADITRSLVGLAVRAGGPRPDIATVEGLKRALLNARSIAYSDGPSGAYIAALLERLGVAQAMKSKTTLTSRPVAELMASGEVEIGMQQIVAILPVAGAELVGPLPSELQNAIIYAAGVSRSAQNDAGAKNCIDFMRGRAAADLIRAKGMQPG
jgi:molybdate transport system substrate-binding protein